MQFNLGAWIWITDALMSTFCVNVYAHVCELKMSVYTLCVCSVDIYAYMHTCTPYTLATMHVCTYVNAWISLCVEHYTESHICMCLCNTLVSRHPWTPTLHYTSSILSTVYVLYDILHEYTRLSIY